jgi:hypothetical protein
MLHDIFKIISFYDDVRWSNNDNYSSINFFSNHLSNDSILLTHWLCYIADRQMPFERIWDVGGFVFSELVYNFTERKIDLSLLLDSNKADSFIRPTLKNNKRGYTFQGYHTLPEEQRNKMEEYGFKPGECIHFTSRYYPSDYFSILATFDLLQHYGNSLVKFIYIHLDQCSNPDECIYRIMFALYLLTYYDIGQPQKESIQNFSENIFKIKKRTLEVLEILNNPNGSLYKNRFNKFVKSTVFYQKRAWCAFRDFLKSPDFRTNFIAAIKKDTPVYSLLFNPDDSPKEEILLQFELPGDVWNNNSKFRKCILEGSKYEKSKTSLNKILRKFYNEHKNVLKGAYPEQFDISFDFVPRMCESNNCSICPIAVLKEKGDIAKVCINNNNFYCPVALVSCNYKQNCSTSKCSLLKILK